MTHYAAIPTVYKGVQFRSRLEARWAAFFDLAKRDWQYEPFDLNGWIPDFSWKIDRPWLAVPLFEIKPVCAFDDITDVGAKMLRAAGHDTPFDLWIAGLDPSAMWRRERDDTWAAQIFPVAWEGAWREAGNLVQWKSPVR